MDQFQESKAPLWIYNLLGNCWLTEAPKLLALKKLTVLIYYYCRLLW